MPWLLKMKFLECWGGGGGGVVGGAVVLGELPVPGRPTSLITVGQGPIALAVGADGGGLEILTLIFLSLLFLLTFFTIVGGRVVRWFWVNFQSRGVLQFGLQ